MIWGHEKNIAIAQLKAKQDTFDHYHDFFVDSKMTIFHINYYCFGLIFDVAFF